MQMVHWAGNPVSTAVAAAAPLAEVVAVVVLFVVVVVGVMLEVMPGTVRWCLTGRTDVMQMLEDQKMRELFVLGCKIT